MWSFRHDPLNKQGVEFLQDCALHLESQYRKITNSDTAQLKAMLQLTLLRIYPYLKDDVTKAFLDSQLSLMM